MNSISDIVAEFYNDVFTKRDLSICDEVIDELYINNSALVENGRGAFKDYFTKYFSSFPSTGAEIKQIFESDDKVCVYATHWAKRWFFTVRFKVIDIYRVEDGLLKEHWDVIEGINTFSKFIFFIKRLLKL